MELDQLRMCPHLLYAKTQESSSAKMNRLCRYSRTLQSSDRKVPVRKSELLIQLLPMLLASFLQRTTNHALQPSCRRPRMKTVSAGCLVLYCTTKEAKKPHPSRWVFNHQTSPHLVQALINTRRDVVCLRQRFKTPVKDSNLY